MLHLLVIRCKYVEIGRYAQVKENLFFQLGFETRTIQPVASRYIDYVIPGS